jgi:hypothetical protein
LHGSDRPPLDASNVGTGEQGTETWLIVMEQNGSPTSLIEAVQEMEQRSLRAAEVHGVDEVHDRADHSESS